MSSTRFPSWLLVLSAASCTPSTTPADLPGTMAVRPAGARGAVAFGEYSVANVRAFRPAAGRLELVDQLFPQGTRDDIGYRFTFSSASRTSEAGCVHRSAIIRSRDFRGVTEPDFDVICSCVTQESETKLAQSHSMLGKTSFISTDVVYPLARQDSMIQIQSPSGIGGVGIIELAGAGSLWLDPSLDEEEQHALACTAAGLLIWREHDP